METNFVSTHDLAIGYKGGKPLAEHLGLVLRTGRTVSMIGSNGIGKSTLLRTLTGDLKPLRGEVSIKGVSLSKLGRRKLATLISLVDTTNGMAGGLTVRQMVELGRQPYTGMLGILSKGDKEICERAMKATGIAHKGDSYVAELSDGERQKAMIARALAQDTPVIYLDEPFSFLDPSARIETMAMLSEIARTQDKAILLTCHDVALSLRMADRLWLFGHEGKVHDLSPDEAVASGLLDRLYPSDKVRFSTKIGDYIID